MSLAFVRIENLGELERERVVLKAGADTKMGQYAVFRCGYTTKNTVSSGPVLNAYWFPNKDIKKDDFVVLYTKTGKNSEKRNDSGATSYFFYWNLPAPMWTSKTSAVVVQTASWKIGQQLP